MKKASNIVAPRVANTFKPLKAFSKIRYAVNVAAMLASKTRSLGIKIKLI